MGKTINEFDIVPAISPVSENIFKRTYGEHIYDYILTNLINANKHGCSGCGYPDSGVFSDLKKILYAHILEINYDNPAESPAVLLCRECHCIQHIDYMGGKNWIKLVNSSYGQDILLKAQRGENRALVEMYKKRKIVNLKKTPEELIEELRAGTYNKNDKIKILFENKYFEAYPLPVNGSI